MARPSLFIYSLVTESTVNAMHPVNSKVMLVAFTITSSTSTGISNSKRHYNVTLL